jgi:hypothetical protein
MAVISSRGVVIGLVGWVLGAGLSVPAFAQAQGGGASPPPPSDADLAQQLSNPVASLVSVPLQFNWDQQVGIDNDTRFTLNFDEGRRLADGESRSLGQLGGG